jgi:uncharacterized protein (DUF169 family)
MASFARFSSKRMLGATQFDGAPVAVNIRLDDVRKEINRHWGPTTRHCGVAPAVAAARH